jgi:uncharacterized phage protein (TIGR01671 family)
METEINNASTEINTNNMLADVAETRAIEFRAYKKSEKRMLPINSLKAICINSERLTEYEWDDLLIMLGTGIYDRKGVQIFDRDIVKHRYKRIWQTKEHTSVVTWCQKYSCFYLFDGTSKHRMRDDIEYEIFGNIHECKVCDSNVC